MVHFVATFLFPDVRPRSFSSDCCSCIQQWMGVYTAPPIQKCSCFRYITSRTGCSLHNPSHPVSYHDLSVCMSAWRSGKAAKFRSVMHSFLVCYHYDGIKGCYFLWNQESQPCVVWFYYSARRQGISSPNDSPNTSSKQARWWVTETWSWYLYAVSCLSKCGHSFKHVVIMMLFFLALLVCVGTCQI